MTENKKSNVSFILTSIILSLLTFFIFVTFLISSSNNLVSSTNDLACRALVMMKDTSIYKVSNEASDILEISNFFSALKNKCKVDYKTIESSDKDVIYEEIGDLMYRCWYRYGEDDYDFMSNWQTTGDWCFLCAQVNFESDIQNQIYPYSDFITWAKNNKIRVNGNETPYFEAIGFKYTEISDLEVLQTQDEIMNILSEGDSGTKELGFILTQQFQSLQDLRLKEINTNEENYIVYRYNRVDKTFEEKLESYSEGVGYTIVASVGLSALTEFAISTGAGALIGSGAGGVGAIPGAFIGAAKGLGKGVWKIFTASGEIVKSTGRVLRITKKIKQLANFIKNSRKEIEVVEEITSLTARAYSGNELKLIKRITEFKATKGELRIFADLAEPSFKLNFKALADLMDEFDVEDLDGLIKAIKTNKKDLSKLENYMQADISPQLIAQLRKEEVTLIQNVDDLTTLRELALGEISKLKKSTDGLDDMPALSDYLKLTTIIGGGLAYGYVDSHYNTNREQYVDIMTKEQYYRTCGTQRFEVTD